MKTLKEIALDVSEHSLLSPHVMHFTEVYEKFFKEVRNEKFRFLLIGAGKGGCIKVWREYFPNAEIFVVDIRPECKELEEPGVEIHIGDQASEDFVKELVTKTGGNFDLIIDDGGHQMYQQINSLILLWNFLNPEGQYEIEDLHTSYWAGFGGSIKGGNMKLVSPNPSPNPTTVDLLKCLVDNLNAIHTTRQVLWDDDYVEYLELKNSDDPYKDALVAEPMDSVNSTLESLHFYDSLAILVKV